MHIRYKRQTLWRPYDLIMDRRKLFFFLEMSLG